MKLKIIFALLLCLSTYSSMRLQQPTNLRICQSYIICFTSQATIQSITVNSKAVAFGNFPQSSAFPDPIWKCFESEITYNDRIEITISNIEKNSPGLGIAAVSICDSQIIELTNPYDWTCDSEGLTSISFPNPPLSGIPSQYIFRASLKQGEITRSLCRLFFNPEPRKPATFKFIVDDLHDFAKINLYRIPDTAITGRNYPYNIRSVDITFREGDRIEVRGKNGLDKSSKPQQQLGLDVATIVVVINYKNRDGKTMSIVTSSDWLCDGAAPFILNKELIGKNNVGYLELENQVPGLIGIWGKDAPSESDCFYTTRINSNLPVNVLKSVPQAPVSQPPAQVNLPYTPTQSEVFDCDK